MKSVRSVIIAVCLCAASATPPGSLFAASGTTDSENRPNVIYILADDLGYGDLGCYGSKLNRTPNIDKMAAEGTRFTDFHASAWCAPSRRGLMTGCHPNRPWDRHQSLAQATMIPEMLRERGYATALIGKWHLGTGKGTHPLDQGFDYWYGTTDSNDVNGPPPHYGSFKNAPEDAWKTPYYVNRERMGIIPQSQTVQRYTGETIRFIKENKDKPFFIYLAHNMPHVPIFASEQFRGKSKNGIFGDVMEELDWSTGKILDSLREAGIDKNTLVVFTSDNGPWTMFKEFGGVAAPLRGQKSTTWDGGSRVPSIFYWPGRIKPNVSSAFMVNTDVYATIAKLTGSTIKDGQAIDSLDMSEVLLNGAENPRTKHIFYFHQPMAYRDGRYKIHFYTRERTRDPMTGSKEPTVRQDPPLLFDVVNDISESKNIAAEHPEVVERLTREYTEAVQAIKDWKALRHRVDRTVQPSQ